MKLQLSRSSGKPASVPYEDSGVILKISPYSKVETEWVEKLNAYKARPEWDSLGREQQQQYSAAAMAGNILAGFDSFTQPSEDGQPEYTVDFNGPASDDMVAIGINTMGEQLMYQDELLSQFVFEVSYDRTKHYDKQAREIVKKSPPAMPSIPL